MLIIGRLEGESIIINEHIEIKIEALKKDKVILSIEAPRDISISRKEYCEVKKSPPDILTSSSV